MKVVKEKKGVIRTGEWNRVSLFVILSLYFVIILTNQLVVVLSKVVMSSDIKVFEIYNYAQRAILI